MKKLMLSFVIICCLFAFSVEAAFHLRVVAPNGGETYKVGSTMKIKWECTSAKAKGKIFLILGSGKTVSHITDFGLMPGQPMQHEFQWKIPNNVAANTKYKIMIRIDYGKSTVVDLSNNVFTIKALPTVSGSLYMDVSDRFAKIKVLNPNGGETIYKGETYRVEWETEDDIGHPTIYIREGASMVYSIHGVVPTSLGGNRYRYNWAVPDDISNGSRYFLRIASGGTKPGMDESDDDFTITDQKITVTQPTEGVTVHRGTSLIIRFRAENITDNLMIWVEGLDPRYNFIVDNLPPTTRSYTWEDVPIVGDGVIPGGNALRIVVSTMDRTISGKSGYIRLVD